MPIPIGYAEQIPTPQAQRSIERCWSYVAPSAGETTILPDGRSDIIVRFHLDKDGRAISRVPVLTGPATRPYIVRFKSGDAWMGLRMRPQYGVALWRGACTAIENAVYRGAQVKDHLPELFGMRGEPVSLSWIERALTTIADRISCGIETQLVDDALRLCHLTGGRVRINELAEQLHCTDRHLQRVFRTSVGLAPKDYARIVQFHRALILMIRSGLSAADSAFEAGYADQSHMVRTIQTYGGFSPSHIPQSLSLPGMPL